MRDLRRLCVSLAVLFVVGSATFTSARGEEWTEFRGPAGQGHSTAKGLPTQWDKSKNIRWKVDLPGVGWSSPVIVAGRLYLTTAVPVPKGKERDRSLRALCLESATGKIVWNVEVFDQKHDSTPRIHGKNSYASPTPIFHQGKIYVHFGTQGTACLNAEDGKAIWKNRTLKYYPQHGNGNSPIIVDDMLFINCDGADVAYVVALNLSNGEVRWKKDRPSVDGGNKFAFATPLLIEVGGQKQIISPAAQVVVAYNPADGEEIWRVNYPRGYSLICRPVFGHGLVFVCTGYNTPSLFAIRPDGKGDVTETHVKWKSSRSIPHTPSPILVGDELYFVSDAGVGTCVDAKTGKIHWTQRLGGKYSASPIFAEGKIYFLSESGEATVIEAGKSYKQVAKNLLNDRTLASYAIDGSALLIRSEQALYRVESLSTAAVSRPSDSK